MARPRKQPIQTPTGGAYGSAQASQQSQAAVPLPQTAPVPTGPPPGDPIAAAQQMAPPQGLLNQVTDQPGALPTHGLPIGPGAGPEALPDPRTFQPVPSDQWLIAQHLPTIEAVANSDGGSSMARQLVRQLRGGLDPRVNQQALVQQSQGADYGRS